MRWIILAASALAMAACSQATTEEAADAATENAGYYEEATDAAHEAGEAVEGAVNDAATAVEHATDSGPEPAGDPNEPPPKR